MKKKTRENVWFTIQFLFAKNIELKIIKNLVDVHGFAF